MAESKKFYSAKEAAVAVLAKAEQMLKASTLMKVDLAKSGMMCKAHGMAKCGTCGPMKKEDPRVENEIGTKMNKGDAPPGEIHPKEHMEGEAMHPGQRTETQPAPGANPHESAEGNNAEWGTDPGVKGHIKLAHFLGHRSAKKKQAPAAPAMDATSAQPPEAKKGIALS